MYLGIEIGGTKLQLGIGDGAGAIEALVRDTIVPAHGADGIRRQIESAFARLMASRPHGADPLRGVGIGFGGPVDDATRSVIKSHQIAGWDGFPLADWIGKLVGLPAVLGNDADVAGLAEATFGAGRGLSPVFYITVGSGIGGGLVINGDIYRGCGRGAAEIGHLRLPDMEGFEQKLENLASGWGIRNVYAELSGDDSLSAADIAQRAAEDDVTAREVIDFAVDRLAEGIGQVIALLCPRRIIIGGGVAQMDEALLLAPLRELVAQRVFRPFAGCYDIVPAALGDEVVVHGALALARKALR